MNSDTRFQPLVSVPEPAATPARQEGYWHKSFRLFIRNKAGMVALGVLILVILFCLFGEHLVPYAYTAQDTSIRNQSPCSQHWFGTDQLGRDLFARVCHGGVATIQIGLFAAVMVCTIGVIYGSISGYLGGRVDTVMMRIVEVCKSIPHLILIILFSIILDAKGIFPLLLALGLTGWMNTAQMIRGQVKQLREREFTIAARFLGVGTARIILRHILPNIVGVLLVAVTLETPLFIFEEAFLSFLGLGLQEPEISWGMLTSMAQPNLIHYPYQVIFPAGAICITMIAFQIVGNALKQAFDPRQRI